MPTECPLRIVASIFKGKGDVRNCNYHSAVKLLLIFIILGIKVVERVLEKSVIE